MSALPNSQPLSGSAVKRPINDAWDQIPESHAYFGTLFHVPESHTFWRNRASGGLSERNALESASEFERFR
jgi:hypothetical protein